MQSCCSGNFFYGDIVSRQSVQDFEVLQVLVISLQLLSQTLCAPETNGGKFHIHQ